MKRHILLTSLLILSALLLFLLAERNPIGVAHAQGRVTVPPVPDGPLEFAAAENVRIRVEVLTRGLSHPWALAFLPGGYMLVTEREGRVRLVRKGVLDPVPVANISVGAVALSGLMDIVLHPKFAENNFVYLTYNKPPGPKMDRTASYIS